MATRTQNTAERPLSAGSLRLVQGSGGSAARGALRGTGPRTHDRGDRGRGWRLKAIGRNRIRSIIEHLLKLEHSPAKEPRAGWRATVRGQRVKLRDALTPLLHREVANELPALYQDARALAEGALRDYGEHPAADALPESCPYSLDQIISDWLPS